MRLLLIIALLLFTTSAGFAQDVPTDPYEVAPLLINETIPDISVRTINDEAISLHEVVKEKPTMFVFYRGGWCPYCSRHMSELAQVEKEILEMGYQIVAISVDRPEVLKKTLEQIEDVYQQFHPKYDFEASFMEDDYNALYDSEGKVAQLSNYMAAIAIIISCLGLFGLAAFTAERKTKEIGIRKVLGASRLAIMRILSSSFVSTLLLAILLAIPTGYLLADGWLQNFAYAIDLSWWIFAIAGLMALLIAWATVSFQTMKAAKTNPVECLRHE